jgi:hypothetical protein
MINARVIFKSAFLGNCAGAVAVGARKASCLLRNCWCLRVFAGVCWFSPDHTTLTPPKLERAPEPLLMPMPRWSTTPAARLGCQSRRPFHKVDRGGKARGDMLMLKETAYGLSSFWKTDFEVRSRICKCTKVPRVSGECSAGLKR